MPFERGPRLPPRMRGEQIEAKPAPQESFETQQAPDAQDTASRDIAEHAARLRRMEENQARKSESQARAAELMANLRSRSDVADVPGVGERGTPTTPSPSFERRGGDANRDAVRGASESLRAAEAQLQNAEVGRQQQERIAAEAYRLAQKERAELERQGYETRNFDLRGAIARNTDKLKRQAQVEAQREGKYAV